ncbi:hypothetical protein TYRP_005209, partial [Tyrophagus putrescentiae]
KNAVAKFKCDLAVFERCVSTLFVNADETFVYPTNLKEMNATCKILHKVDKCSKDYLEYCLKGETKTVAKIILYGNARQNRLYCSNAARKTTFTIFGRCANRHKAEIYGNTVQLNRDLHAVAAYPVRREKINLTNTYTFKKRMMKTIADCTQAEQDAFEAFLDGSSTDGMSVMCTVQENSDECKRLQRKLPKWGNKPLRRKVIFLSIIDVLETKQQQSASNKKINFKCDHKKFEASIDRFFYTGDSDFIWPTTLAEQNANCKKIKEVERYCKDYVENCLKRETRNIFKVL